MFDLARYRLPMPEQPTDLRPATGDEIAQALAFALQYDGRRRVHDGDGLAARIAADRLVRHLEQSGFVVMKKPPGQSPTTANMSGPGR